MKQPDCHSGREKLSGAEVAEFYVVASENMRPVEAIGPFPDRECATKVVTILKLTRLRFPLGIASRRPAGIPIMPARNFVLELEAAMEGTRPRGNRPGAQVER